MSCVSRQAVGGFSFCLSEKTALNGAAAKLGDSWGALREESLELWGVASNSQERDPPSQALEDKPDFVGTCGRLEREDK